MKIDRTLGEIDRGNERKKKEGGKEKKDGGRGKQKREWARDENGVKVIRAWWEMIGEKDERKEQEKEKDLEKEVVH